MSKPLTVVYNGDDFVTNIKTVYYKNGDTVFYCKVHCLNDKEEMKANAIAKLNYIIESIKKDEADWT